MKLVKFKNPMIAYGFRHCFEETEFENVNKNCRLMIRQWGEMQENLKDKPLIYKKKCESIDENSPGYLINFKGLDIVIADEYGKEEINYVLPDELFEMEK